MNTLTDMGNWCMDGHQRGEHLLDTVFSVDRTSRSIDVPDRSQVCRGWTGVTGAEAPKEWLAYPKVSVMAAKPVSRARSAGTSHGEGGGPPVAGPASARLPPNRAGVRRASRGDGLDRRLGCMVRSRTFSRLRIALGRSERRPQGYLCRKRPNDAPIDARHRSTDDRRERLLDPEGKRQHSMTEVDFGPRDRQGPKAPTASTPPRAPGSVRRTTTLDGLHPDGPGGPTQLVLRARDLRTELDGRATELGHAEVRMRVEPGGSVLEIGADPAEPRLAELVGANPFVDWRRQRR